MAEDAAAVGDRDGARLVEELKESLRQAARGEGLTETDAIRRRVERIRGDQ